MQAVRESVPVRFGYRTLGRPEPEQREVEPWGVVSWHGRWYLVGFDTVRGAERVFRLSRVVGEVEPTGEPGAVTVPEGVDLRGAGRADGGRAAALVGAAYGCAREPAGRCAGRPTAASRPARAGTS